MTKYVVLQEFKQDGLSTWDDIGEHEGSTPKAAVAAAVEAMGAADQVAAKSTRFRVAVCELVDVQPIGHEGDLLPGYNVPPDELAFGNYEGGRYGWILDNVRPLEIPLPASGALGLWEVAGVCRGCGCTDVAACDEGCWWVEASLCSSCVPSAAAA